MCIGDVVGRPGREALRAHVPRLRDELGLACVIANGENAAGGVGITAQSAEDMFQCGVDVITLGNHTWKHDKDIAPYLAKQPRVIRPANFPAGTPGSGLFVGPNFAVINVIGRVYMEPCDSPFDAVDAALARVPAGVPVIVDMHAEALS